MWAFAYVTRARLGKAVDAACLTGMKNLYQGQTQATIMAKNAFNANYQPVGDLPGSPVVTVTFPVVAGHGSNRRHRHLDYQNGFHGNYSRGKTLTVSDTAQALRGTLVMSFVLDRSGSMANNKWRRRRAGAAICGPALSGGFPHYRLHGDDQFRVQRN